MDLPMIGCRNGSNRVMPIYLDHNASTPPAPEVVEAMLAWLGGKHANPHSDHLHGRLAAQAVEQAKNSVAELIGASADEIVFTSGATEASNLAIQGYLRIHGAAGALIYSAVEHPCVRELANALAQSGTAVEEVGVDRRGRIDQTWLSLALGAVSGRRSLVSIIHANNEVGTVQDPAPLGALAHDHGASLHLDASQSLGSVEIDVANGIDLMTLSSHKVGGPPGIGALFVADGLAPQLSPLSYGGGQQNGLRPGTIPVFLAVGFGVACDLIRRDRAARARFAQDAADAFMNVLVAHEIDFEVIGCPIDRLPGLKSVRFPGIEARDLLERLQTQISASASSACASGDYRASHVLRAIGLDESEAMQVVRFGFGWATSPAEAAEAGVQVSDALNAIQGSSKSVQNRAA